MRYLEGRENAETGDTNMTVDRMIGIDHIEITRAEGRNDADYSVKTCSTWKEANAIIEGIASTVEGHADKVDFQVTFDDGYIWAGTICVNAENKSISDHIRQFLAFELGLAKPAHLSEAQYNEFLIKRSSIPAAFEELQRVATTYRIG